MPIASVTFPEKWEVQANETSVEVVSDDEEIYFYIESYDGSELAGAITAALETLGENGVKVDAATKKQTELSHNGLQILNVDWKGTSEGEACEVSLAVITQDDKRALLLIYVASPEAEKKHEKHLQAIRESLKAAK
jgi:hypothetical protein